MVGDRAFWRTLSANSRKRSERERQTAAMTGRWQDSTISPHPSDIPRICNLRVFAAILAMFKNLDPASMIDCLLCMTRERVDVFVPRLLGLRTGHSFL